MNSFLAISVRRAFSESMMGESSGPAECATSTGSDSATTTMPMVCSSCILRLSGDCLHGQRQLPDANCLRVRVSRAVLEVSQPTAPGAGSTPRHAVSIEGLLAECRVGVPNQWIDGPDKSVVAAFVVDPRNDYVRIRLKRQVGLFHTHPALTILGDFGCYVTTSELIEHPNVPQPVNADGRKKLLFGGIASGAINGHVGLLVKGDSSDSGGGRDYWPGSVCATEYLTTEIVTTSTAGDMRSDT